MKPNHIGLDLDNLAQALKKIAQFSPEEIVMSELRGLVGFHIDEGQRSEIIKEVRYGDPVNIQSRAKSLRQIASAFSELANKLDEVAEMYRADAHDPGP